MRPSTTTPEDDNLMQELRNSGMAIREIAEKFELSVSSVQKKTKNPRAHSEEEKRINSLEKAVYSTGKNKRKSKADLKFLSDKRTLTREEIIEQHKVRVLTSVPSGFKAPTRGMGW